MHLDIGYIKIRDIQFGAKSEIKDGVLYVDSEGLAAACADRRIQSLEAFIARPGESVRIIPVKDVIEPRCKAEGPGGVFPGFISDVEQVGEGRTQVLRGAAVVTTGRIVGFQEGVIDMSGPGAEYTPFSQTCNLVLKIEPVEGIGQHEHEEILRLAGLKAAAYIGETGRDIEPEEIVSFETLPLPEQLAAYPGLPKVVYVYMLQTQGLLHNTYFYGVDVKQIVPTFIYPTEVMDGAIVSGNCVSACDKNPTYVHLNNPVIEDLYAEHGKSINFLGCVITNENVTLIDKQRSSNMTAKLVRFLGAEAAIISEEGFGNPDADLVMNCNKLEQMGVKTVLITDEYAGRDGASQSLADSTPLGNACVTAGNANQVVILPPLDTVYGYAEAANTIAGGWAGSLKPDGSIEAEIQVITGSTNELGFHRLTAREL